MNWFQRVVLVKTDGEFQTTIETNIPRYCLPEYWIFHKLTYNDILTITDCLPAQYCWITVLLMGIKVSASAIYPSYASMYDVLISSKIIAIKKIIKKTNLTWAHNTDSKVLYSHGHIPPIPFHMLPDDMFEKIGKHIVPLLCIMNVNEVTFLFEWSENIWLPREHNDKCIRCQMVIPMNEFIDHMQIAPKDMVYATRPIEIIYMQEKFVLLPESVLFLCEKELNENAQ